MTQNERTIWISLFNHFLREISQGRDPDDLSYNDHSEEHEGNEILAAADAASAAMMQLHRYPNERKDALGDILRDVLGE